MPMMAKMSVLTLERPSFMPKGMASFRFKSGVIAAKKTVSSWGMNSSLYLTLLYLVLLFNVKA